MPVPLLYCKYFCVTGAVPSRLEKSEARQYLQLAQYCASCNWGVMPIQSVNTGPNIVVALAYYWHRTGVVIFDILYWVTTGAVHWKNGIAERTIFWSSEPENIAIRSMLRLSSQNYTSIGETAILVFLNVILLREG